MRPDPNEWRGLYAIIDVEACAPRSPREVAAEVLAGGCAVLQLRAKRSTEAETRALAHELRALCAHARIPFVINDHPALAAEVGADGVHLGQGDMPLARARALAPNACLGLSTHTLAQAERAAQLGADLIGFGPVFATRTKDDPDPVVGTEALAALMTTARLPVVAIGGIDRSNIAAVARTGVPLIACIGALCKASDPRAAAAELHARALSATSTQP